MMSEQNQQIRKRVDEWIQQHRALISFAGCFSAGMANEVFAWRKHDIGEAVVSGIIFFVVGPFITIGFRKLIGPLDD